MRLLADDGVSKGAIRLAPRVFNSSKVRAQAGGEVIYLAYALYRLRFIQHDDVASFYLRWLVLQMLDSAAQAGNTASWAGVQTRFQVFDLALTTDRRDAVEVMIRLSSESTNWMADSTRRLRRYGPLALRQGAA